jgi:glycosyltransferase involved in cell wall biosynthesis
MLLSIVVPCYNEAKNIPLILDRFRAVISRDDVEVVLVNNGSQDTTEEVLDKLLPQYPFARTVRVPINKGYGFGIREGLHSAKGAYVGWTHADMQTDPGDVVRALEIIEREGLPQNCYLKGTRKGRSVVDVLFTIGMSVFESCYLGVVLWDINAQPNIFHRSFMECWRLPPDDFSLDLYALYMARKQHLAITRFPVLFPERVHGISHWNTSLGAKWKFIKRTVDFSVRMKRGLLQ